MFYLLILLGRSIGVTAY